MSNTSKLELVSASLGVLAAFALYLALWWSQDSESGPWSTNFSQRDELRPEGDFRTLVYERITYVQIVSSDEGRCRAAHALGHMFSWINETERAAIEDKMIAKMSGLLDHDTDHGTHKCVSYVIGGIFIRIGARATAALPSLERALKAAELARSARVSTPAECAGFEFNPDSRLDYVLRRALVSIDGREREKGYVLRCPKDGDPPG